MSATDENGEEIPTREIAYRLFAAEYDDASFSYAESDEERAPNYVISPTGARLNRLFAVGTLTEITSVNEEMVRARVVDPTGAFVVYAGQYQPDALATLEQLEPPAFVAVTGKARTFQPDDSEQVYTSIRPESIATVDADTRDRWVVSAAEQTVDRIGAYATAAESDASGDALADALREAGVESGLAAGIPLALDHYGTTPAYLEALRDCALEAVEVVAGERDQVTPLSLQPSDSPDTDATFSSLAAHADIELSSLESTIETEPDAESQPAEPAAATAGVGDAEGDASVDAGSESIDAGSAAGTATGSEPDAASDAESAAADEAADSALESESDADAETDTGDSAAAAGTADTAAADADDETDETDEQTASFDESTDVDEAVDTDDSATTDDGDSADAADEGAEDDLGDFDAGDTGMYEMDDEEREQLEEEFGAEFTTGSEVEEPGEAGIDVPEPEDELEDAPDGDSVDAGADSADSGAEPDDDLGEPPASGLETDSESDAAATDDGDSEADDETDVEVDDIDATDDTAPSESDAESESDADEEPAEDVDLEAYVVDTMADLDDGDGADRSTVVETVADETGASEDEVEDAIQDALMGGQCYEPNDETLKPI
ncbi:hypothetical protein [Natronorubrum texcoconense]|uniref:Rpa-associated protein n=1 Tax=Natronorubrum texcoconense TaxID=1095776 RepID=A0A1G9FV49_9EURY|nr:hypothetical protein [Natronorubrum texcoconense]SDK92301.1 hypothetical protein SAMN04515672_4301 [Natronorubrum texcoconense]